MELKTKFFLICTALCLPAAPVFAQSYKDTIPAWLVPLREVVYEQKLLADAALPVYNTAKEKALSEYSGAESLYLVSRCEYFIGRIYQFDKQNKKAISFFEAGLEAAERSISIKESALGWEMRAANLAQLCSLKSVAFAVANGLDVEKFSKNALKFDSRNAPAQYMIASRWVYAPAPFNDTKKGIKMMQESLNGGASLQKDDLFNIWVALAYGYLRENKKKEAGDCIDKALLIYPTNKFVGIELKGKL
ncbi:MAG: hypothetical protein LBG79_08765 [Spirochaetaceae bacterium]|jgi:tetratricopeptide (TPR) repeat protein|nr:hypothetical protein [Spirochaetaceae bacterium]